MKRFVEHYNLLLSSVSLEGLSLIDWDAVLSLLWCWDMEGWSDWVDWSKANSQDLRGIETLG